MKYYWDKKRKRIATEEEIERRYNQRTMMFADHIPFAVLKDMTFEEFVKNRYTPATIKQLTKESRKLLKEEGKLVDMIEQLRMYGNEISWEIEKMTIMERVCNNDKMSRGDEHIS